MKEKRAASNVSLWIALAAIWGVLAPTAGAAQQMTGQVCLPPAVNESVGTSVVDLWEQDRRVYVDRGSGPAGAGATYRILGDVVELTAERFPSLARVAGQSLTDVAEILVEGRTVVVAMPIRLASGSLRIRAERVHFHFDGVVSFSDPPGKVDQVLEISAGEIDLSAARSVPFNFASQDWDAPQGKRRWGGTGQGKRLIVVNTGTLRLGRTGPSEIGSAADNVLNELATRSQDGFEMLGRDRSQWTSSYRVSLSDIGLQAYRSLLATELEWPDASVVKLQRVFSYAPFSADTHVLAKRFIEQYGPLFRQRRSQTASLGLDRLQAAMSGYVDLFGLDQIAVPMTTAGIRLEKFARLLGTQFGSSAADTGLLAAWDEHLVKVSGGTGVNAESVRALQDEALRLEKRLTVLTNAVTDKQQLVASAENQIANVSVQYQNREQKLVADWQREQEDKRKRGEVFETTFKAVAIVGSVAFPAAAPFLAAGSAAVEIGQQRGGGGEGLLERVRRIGDVIERHNGIVENSAAIRKSWKKVKADFSGAVEYAKGVERTKNKVRFDAWRASLGEVGKASEALFAMLEHPGQMEQVGIPKFAESDKELLKLAATRSLTVTRQGELHSELIVLQREYEQVAKEFLENQSVSGELLSLNLRNDEQRARYRHLATWARRTLMRQIAREAVLLKRSLAYVGVQLAGVPQDVLFVGEVDEAERAGRDGPQDGLKGRLAEERKRRAATYFLFLEAAKEAYARLSERGQWNIPVPITFSAASSGVGKETLSTVQGRFLAEVNAQIEAAIRGLPTRPLRIPFEAKLVGSTERAVLLGINIPKVRIEGGGDLGGHMNLVIEHPRFGSVWQDGKCVFVRDAALTPREGELVRVVGERWPVAVPADVSANWGDKIRLVDRFTRIQDAMYPFYSSYYLHVEVPQPTGWARIPRITELEIQFIVTRLR